MIEFDSWFVVVRRHVPQITGVPVNEVPPRILRPSATSFPCPSHRGSKCSLEFDGEFVWRVLFSDYAAPDGVKSIAYVIGGIHRYAVPSYRGEAHKAHEVCDAMVRAFLAWKEKQPGVAVSGGRS